MRKLSKESLLRKAMYHEDKAREYYYRLEEIERKESLIGFKIPNDGRMCSDRHEVYVTQPKWHEIDL